MSIALATKGIISCVVQGQDKWHSEYVYVSVEEPTMYVEEFKPRMKAQSEE